MRSSISKTFVPPNVTDFTSQMTLSRFLFTKEMMLVAGTSEFTEILNSFQIIAKSVSSMLQTLGLSRSFDPKDKKKDTNYAYIMASNMFFRLLSTMDSVAVLVSEKGLIEVNHTGSEKFIVVYNTLESLPNVNIGLNTGSIFSILVKNDGTVPAAEDVTSPNTTMLAAGYILYGNATVLVLSTSLGVNEFILDPYHGEFILTQRNLKVPEKGHIYSVNEGYMGLWEDPIKEYIREKKFPEKKKAYFSRYVGSMVADVHRTLKHGGIFLYPAHKEAPEGKLKLLSVCKPIAFIIAQAGGMASNGTIPIMDVEVKDVFQRTQVFFGSVSEVTELIELIKIHRTRNV